jgi:hypothetical protein
MIAAIISLAAVRNACEIAIIEIYFCSMQHCEMCGESRNVRREEKESQLSSASSDLLSQPIDESMWPLNRTSDKQTRELQRICRDFSQSLTTQSTFTLPRSTLLCLIHHFNNVYLLEQPIPLLLFLLLSSFLYLK